MTAWTTAARRQFGEGWRSASWLTPFTLLLIPVCLVGALLARILFPPQHGGFPVPHGLVVGIAGVFLTIVGLFCLIALILGLLFWSMSNGESHLMVRLLAATSAHCTDESRLAPLVQAAILLRNPEGRKIVAKAVESVLEEGK